MKIDMKNFIPAMVLGIVFMGIIVAVQPYPMAAKRLPVAMSIIGMLLTAIIMVKAARPKKEKDEKEQEATISHKWKQKKIVPVRERMEALAWVASILLFVYLLGLQYGIPLYAFLYCRLHGGRWLGSITLGLGLFMFIYLILVVLLNILLPPGLLFELFTEQFPWP